MVKKNGSISCHRHTESGLSLIEICILLIIFSLLLIPALHVMSLENRATEAKKHNGTTVDLANALSNYALENGAYPIPAAPRLALNNPKVFMPAVGTEIPTNCIMGGAEGTTVGTGNNGLICRPRFSWDVATDATLHMYIGTLPVSVLGLSPEQGLDEYGRKFTYIVTKNLTNPATFSDTGGRIEIKDTIDTYKFGNAHFLVISHGQNGVGGWTRNGDLLGPAPTPATAALTTLCAWGAGTGKAEYGNQYQCKYNSSGNGRVGFARVTFKGLTANQEKTTYQAVGESFYDDSIEYRQSVYGRLWTPRDDSGTPNEYFSAKGNVGIGATDNTVGPSQRLTLVYGNILATPAAPGTATTAKSTRFCNAIVSGSGSGCFMPEDVATNLLDSPPLKCADKVGLRQVLYNAGGPAGKTCNDLPINTGNFPTCANGIKGMTATGTPICN